jgi:hypothetical protein
MTAQLAPGATKTRTYDRRPLIIAYHSDFEVTAAPVAFAVTQPRFDPRFGMPVPPLFCDGGRLIGLIGPISGVLCCLTLPPRHIAFEFSRQSSSNGATETVAVGRGALTKHGCGGCSAVRTFSGFRTSHGIPMTSARMDVFRPPGASSAGRSSLLSRTGRNR